MKIVDLTLPEWAWLNGGEHENGGDTLEGRNVILHVRSASVIEFLIDNDFMPVNDDVVTYPFAYDNIDGITEHHVAVLHYSATTDDREELSQILEKAAEWYCDYMSWEDQNITDSDFASMN